MKSSIAARQIQNELAQIISDCLIKMINKDLSRFTGEEIESYYRTLDKLQRR